MNEILTTQIIHHQRQRIAVLILLHAPLLLLWWLGAGVWAFALMLVLHAVLLWGTLNPASSLFGPVVRILPTTERCVYLTIDDGPSADTPAILALLASHQATATFFVVGERASAQPQMVRAIQEAGHGIGNHTHTHPAATFWCLPPARMTQQILTAQNTLMTLTGKPVRWFRSVAGHTNPFVQPVLTALGSRRAGWAARGFDAVNSDVQRVVTALTANLQPGQILLLHEGAAHGRNVAMLAAVLDELKHQGYVARALPDEMN